MSAVPQQPVPRGTPNADLHNLIRMLENARKPQEARAEERTSETRKFKKGEPIMVRDRDGSMYDLSKPPKPPRTTPVPDKPGPEHGRDGRSWHFYDPETDAKLAGLKPPKKTPTPGEGTVLPFPSKDKAPEAITKAPEEPKPKPAPKIPPFTGAPPQKAPPKIPAPPVPKRPPFTGSPGYTITPSGPLILDSKPTPNWAKTLKGK